MPEVSKHRILVVEDNADNLVLIQDVLNSFHYEMVSARDGQEAIDVARACHPDLILMDLSLPRMDGWTAARHIKDDPTLASIPIIALTAHALTGDRERALAAGCNDYLTKPLSLRELSAKLRAYMPQE